MEYGSFQAEEFGDLQRLVDGLFYDRHAIDRLDLIVQAEILDLAPDLMEIVNLLPPGYYDRQSLCDQLNSALAAHGWAPSTAPWNKPSHWGLWSKNSKYEYCYFFSNSDFELKRPVLAFCARFWKDASAFFVQPRNR